MKKLVYEMVNFKDKATGEYLTFPTLKGDKGDTGKSAYQSAVELGYTGTEAEWLESLKYVSSPEYDTLLAALAQKEQNAAQSAASAASDAESAKNYYDAISGLKGFEVVVLEEGEYADGVPTIENPKDSTFYFVPSGNGGNNNYNEYIYVNNAWEMVGAKEVNLEPYVLRTELEAYATTEALNDYALASSLDNYATAASLEDYATKEDLEGYTTTTDLEKDYALKSELVTAEEKASWNAKLTQEELSIAASQLATGINGVGTMSQNHIQDTTVHVTADDKTAWNAKYDLPETGIPEEALSTDVRVKLNSFFEADPVDKDLLAAYALKTELLDYQPKSDMKNYATKESLNDYAKSSDLDAYATVESLNDYATTESLEGYLKSEDLEGYVKSEDLEDYAKTEDLDDYATVASLENYTTTEDLSTNYALKTELVSDTDKTAWSAKYDKPSDGIPLTDLSQDVQDIINNPQIEVDETLSVEGAAADAKTTGEILATKVGPEEIVKFVQWDNAVDGVTMSTTNNMVVLTEAEYEALKIKLPNTYYFVYEEVDEL